MVNIIYRISHRVSDELETWLVSQPNRVGSIRLGDNFTEITYNHTAQEAIDFKKLLAERSTLYVDGQPDNVNRYDTQMGGAGYYDLPIIAAPANPASGFKRVFINQATGEASAKSSAGVVASLEAQGAGGGDTYAVKTSDQLLIGTAYANVTGTELAVAANTNYEFEFNIIADADAVTTGIDISCNGPAIGTGNINYTVAYWISATATTFKTAAAYDFNTASTASQGATRAIFRVFGILRNGANAGTLVARIKRENVGTGPNARAGSYGRIKQI